MASTTKRIRTVLYDDQNISRSELELLHTHTFQRLYGLHQLGLADRVFIDASHSRLHHVVGVLAQVEKLVNAVVGNLQRTPLSEITYGAGTPVTIKAKDLAEAVDKARPIARLIGFLHDLTHAPYGHTVEDEIELMATKHDDPERQADAYYRLLVELVGWLATDLGEKPDDTLPAAVAVYLSDPELAEVPPVEEVSELAATMLSIEPSKTRLFWRLRPDEVVELVAQLNVAMTALLHLEVLHASEPKRKLFPASEYPFQRLIRQILVKTNNEALLLQFKFVPQRDAYLLDIVGNTVCADILDYAQRDAYYANLKLSYDADRIAENFTLVSWNASTYHLQVPGAEKRKCPDNCPDPFSGSSIRAAISLFSHKLRTDVPGELMNLLNVRFYLYERAIYHPTKSAAGAMLGTALQLLGWNRQPDDDTSDILPHWLRFVGDDVFVFMVHRAAHLALSAVGPGTTAQKHISPIATAKASLEMRLALEILQANRGTEDESDERRKSRVTEIKRNISAAIGLLDRLRARRFVRPVFRALPNVTPVNLDVSAATMASKFKQPAARFETERLIEIGAKLPRGSITIHCPRENTAEKIANVLLVLPPIPTDKGHTSEKIRKLCDIAKILDGVFAAHAQAILGVQQMYKSMWRLVVYVAPEHFHHWEEIERVAGRCLFEALAGRPQANQHETLPNDDMLRYEIQLRMRDTEPQEMPQPQPLRIEELTTELAALINQASTGTVDPEAVGRDVREVFEKHSRVLPALKYRRFERLHVEATMPYFGDQATAARVLIEKSLGDRLLAFDSSEFEFVMREIQQNVGVSNKVLAIASQPLFRRGKQFKTWVGDFVANVLDVLDNRQKAN